MGRSDWQAMRDCFCYGYRTGYRFVRTRAGHGRSNGSYVGIAADGCTVDVQVEASAPEGTLIANGTFAVTPDPNGATPTHVVTTRGHAGSVRFVDCGFLGASRRFRPPRGAGHRLLRRVLLHRLGPPRRRPPRPRRPRGNPCS